MERRIDRALAIFAIALLFFTPAAFGAGDAADGATTAREAADGTPTSERKAADMSAELSAKVNAGSQAASASSGLSGPLSKLTVHGYLSQAYADADFFGGRLPNPVTGAPAGPTAEEIVLGIPEDGTWDYRNMALQFRYQISPKDVMVIQFSNRSLGDSPINDVEDEVELDWAFYERRFGDYTSIKVGRVQIPLGIFNEIRDVGTILPFYRPPFVFYREGTFTSETVDGIDISHTFAAESDWSLDLDVYIGEWESFELSFFDESVTLADNEGYGFQFWLNTPVSGLRFGLGGHQRDVTGGSEGAVRLPGATSKFEDYYVSVDGIFDRFVVRGEYREFTGDPEVVPAFAGGVFEGDVILYYGQLGFNINDNFRIFVQAEFQETENSATSFTRDFDVTLREDYGIALTYLVSANLVLKAEYHEVEGNDIGFVPAVFFPDGSFLLEPIIQKLDAGSYSIFSLSTSF